VPCAAGRCSLACRGNATCRSRTLGFSARGGSAFPRPAAAQVSATPPRRRCCPLQPPLVSPSYISSAIPERRSPSSKSQCHPFRLAARGAPSTLPHLVRESTSDGPLLRGGTAYREGRA